MVGNGVTGRSPNYSMALPPVNPPSLPEPIGS